MSGLRSLTGGTQGVNGCACGPCIRNFRNVEVIAHVTAATLSGAVATAGRKPAGAGPSEPFPFPIP